MQRVILLIILGWLSTVGRVAAQAPAWHWQGAIQTDSIYSLGVSATAIDSLGNIYLTGSFADSIRLGAFRLQSVGRDTTPSGRHRRDLFVAKLSPQGQWLWAVSAGGRHDDGVVALTLDAHGAPCLTGQLNFGSRMQAPDTTWFGATRIITQQGNGTTVLGVSFVAKLSTAGAWQWVHTTQGTGQASHDITDLKRGRRGELVLTGYARGTVALAGHPVPQGTYLIGLDETGGWLWSELLIAGTQTFVTSMTADSTGAIWVAGAFAGTVVLGGQTLVSAGEFDLFVARLSPTRQWEWVVRAGGPGNDFDGPMVTDSQGNVYIACGLDSGAVFGSFQMNDPRANNCVARLSATGVWQWLSVDGYMCDAWTMALLNDTSLVTGGALYDPMSFGTQTLTPTSPYGQAFVGARRLTDGAWQWGIMPASSPFVTSGIAAVGVAAAGTYYTFGQFLAPAPGPGTLTFGPSVLTATVPRTLVPFVATLGFGPTGLPEDGAAAGSLWPNPATTTAQFTVPAPLPAAVPVQLLDALGRPVRTTTLPAGQVSTTLSVAGLPAGLYTVRCGAQTRRLVVQ